MKQIYIVCFCVLSAFLIFGGCSSFSLKKDLDEAQQRYAFVDTSLDERSREITTAIVDLSQYKIDNEDFSPVDELIKLFAAENQRIQGLPIERVDVIALLEEFKINRQALLKKLEFYEDQNTHWLKEKQRLESSINVLTEQLSVEKNKSIFSRLWGWFKGLGLSSSILLILGIIFFPGITIPLISAIFKWVTKRIPQIIGLFGVVGKEVSDEIIKSIQNIKDEVDRAPEDKTFSKAEIKNLVSSKLKSNTTDATKRIINYRKEKLHLKNA